MARKQRQEKPDAPVEARWVVVGLTVGEVALALLVAWLLTRSELPRHASRSVHMGAGDVFTLVAMLACLGLLVFVLAFWQWRLRGRDRVRILLAGYLSLLGTFCGLCWYDASVRAMELPAMQASPTTVQRVIEQTAASGLALASLVAGLTALAAILRLARRSLNPIAPGGIVDGEPQEPFHV